MATPRESWLRSDDPEKWAAAMTACRSAAADCGRKGYCEYGDCFRRPRSPSARVDAVADLERRVSDLEAKIESLTNGRTYR